MNNTMCKYNVISRINAKTQRTNYKIPKDANSIYRFYTDDFTEISKFKHLFEELTFSKIKKNCIR